jgi:exosortase A-associated hydrolase 1
MAAEERFVVFDCLGNRLVGVLHLPENASRVGIVLIGRLGTDRGSVHFGRAAAGRGIAVFRFDFRGRGDCEGPLVPVEETGEDLRSALEAFRKHAPGIQRVVIFGVSEGGAAALLYAREDFSVAGLILVNPWIRMEKAVAKESLRQNLSKVTEKSFWSRIRKSESGYLGAAKSFLVLVRNWIAASTEQPTATEPSLKDKLSDALEVFPGPILIVLSGGDPATPVFLEAVGNQLQLLERQGRLTIMTEPDANHVFSRSDWRATLIAWSLDWTEQLT